MEVWLDNLLFLADFRLELVTQNASYGQTDTYVCQRLLCLSLLLIFHLTLSETLSEEAFDTVILFPFDILLKHLPCVIIRECTKFELSSVAEVTLRADVCQEMRHV